MSYELEKIRTLSQGNGSYKTELYPKTLIDAVYSVNGEKLEDLMYQTIADEIMKTAIQINPIPNDDMTVLVARVYPVV